MLKVNAAIPLPFPVILVSQILLGEGGCDKVSNGQKKKKKIVYIIPSGAVNTLRRDVTRQPNFFFFFF